MGDTQTQRVYRMIDNLTDTMSWAELAKELNRYASELDRGTVSSPETMEIDSFVQSQRDKTGGGSDPK